MAIPRNTTPLIALDAVVIDSETTGLNPVKARLLELAAIPLSGMTIDTRAMLSRRVRPGAPIPPAATAIHGIDDATVASAPAFSEAWPPFIPLFAERLVIGHSLGFDLVVLRNECERAHLPWTAPRALDTRLLAQAVRPDLAGHSLEQLAAWLDIETSDRHSAAGDALTTARIFLALIPHLRERGVRTLAEAEQACRKLTSAMGDEHQTGWLEVVAQPGAIHDQPLLRLDTLPYRRRVGEVMSEPLFTMPDASVVETIRRLARDHVSSLFVATINEGEPRRPEHTGIVTERDLLRTIADVGAGALQRTVGSYATSPVLTVPADAFLYRAIGRMRRLKVRHLGITDEDGALCGVVSARDLLRQRSEEAIWLGDAIDEASDVSALARIWVNLPLLAESLRVEQVPGREVAGVISRELGALSRRAIELAERELLAECRSGPPCPYAFALLGSAGRGESMLAPDQDNALVFAEGDPEGSEDRWFAALASRTAEILHEAGVPYCQAGVMARNPQWRGSMATWRTRIGEWIRRSDPRDLLAVDIFFDLRGVQGDLTLANRLRVEAYDRAAGEIGFARVLAEAAGASAPGLGLFGRIRTAHGRIDLKKCGLLGIVTTARVLAIRHHIVERATLARLESLKELGLGAGPAVEALAQEHGIFMDLILDQQIDDLAQGTAPSNTVVVKRLAGGDRERLHHALEAVRHLDEMTRDLLSRPEPTKRVL